MSNTKRALRTLNKNVWQRIVARDIKKYKNDEPKLYTQVFEVASNLSVSSDEVEVSNKDQKASSKSCTKSVDDVARKEKMKLSDAKVKNLKMLNWKVRFDEEEMVEHIEENEV